MTETEATAPKSSPSPSLAPGFDRTRVIGIPPSWRSVRSAPRPHRGRDAAPHNQRSADFGAGFAEDQSQHDDGCFKCKALGFRPKPKSRPRQGLHDRLSFHRLIPVQLDSLRSPVNRNARLFLSLTTQVKRQAVSPRRPLELFDRLFFQRLTPRFHILEIIQYVLNSVPRRVQRLLLKLAA